MQQFGFPFQQSLKTQLPPAVQELISAAEQAADKAYAPYSNFKVGAALVQTDGTMLTGANHENAAFPAGICAERALFGSLDMGSGNKVLAIAVAYKTDSKETHPPLAPCGICRQTILEAQLHQHQPIAVYMCSPDGQVIMVEDASYLLPFHFSSAYL